jgi:hypothetical protein
MADEPDKPTHDLYALFRDGDDEELTKAGTLCLGEDGTGSLHIRWIPTSGWRNRAFIVPHGAAPPQLAPDRTSEGPSADPAQKEPRPSVPLPGEDGESGES